EGICSIRLFGQKPDDRLYGVGAGSSINPFCLHCVEDKINGVMKLIRHIFFCLVVGAAMVSCKKTVKQFTLIPSQESGLTFRNDLRETQHNNIMTYEYSYNGGGVAVGDVNGDGLADVYFTGNTVPNKL